MAVQRRFLGWDGGGPEMGAGGGAPLDRACDWLLGQRPDFDFAGMVIVTPGKRIGRLMLGMLVDRAQALGEPLSPPTLCTAGELGALIVRPLGKIAQVVQRRMAWARAIEAAGSLDALLPHLPTDQHSRLGIAAMLERVHQELIGEGIGFGDVPALAAHMDEREAERWREAAGVQELCRVELEAAGLVDEGLALLEALEAGRAPHLKSVVLVGLPDLNEVARRAVSLAGVETEVLVFAPAELADLFDDIGRVKVEAWKARAVPLDDADIIFAENPADQARHFAEILGRLGGAYSAHDITVGVPDETVTPHLVRAAERYAGVDARAAAGSPLASSTIYQLLAAMQKLLEEGTFAALAALVRQPDMERYLLRSFQGDRIETWLGWLDEYNADHMPAGDALGAAILTMRDEPRVQLEKLQRTVRSVLQPLMKASPRAGDLLAVMQRVFLGSEVSREDPRGQDTIRASKIIAAAAAHVGELPEAWQPETGANLIHLILDACKTDQLPPERTAEAIELLGWLELPLDPAPVAIVTGVNDGMLPESYGADPLLPDSLRAHLGIACSDRRLARDVFLLTLLAKSRTVLKLICGRRGAGGDPLLPSRLLFAADDATVVQRVRRYCDHDAALRPIIRSRREPGGKDLFPRLYMDDGPPVTSMSVTSFRTYIRSPYLFYLQHVLRLEEYQDPEHELDPMAFGSVIHKVLQRFAGTDAKDSTSEQRVRECLLDLLATESASRFGPAPSLPIAVQLEMARLRLTEFATWQAERRAGGWAIAAAEWRPANEHVLLPGMAEPFYIRGSIDRIDVHDNGEVAILDYKTGEETKAPNSTHRRSGSWVDLQLPLYRHLAAERGLPPDPGKLTLGYIRLPRTPGGVTLLPATWSADDLASADATAREIAAKVHRREFRSLGDSPATEGTFAALSGTALATPPGTRDESERSRRDD